MAIACKTDGYTKQIKRLMATVPVEALDFQDKWILKPGDYTGDGENGLIAFVCTEYPSEEGAAETYQLYYCRNEKVSVYDTICGWFYQAPKVHNIDNVSLLTYTIGSGGPSGESFCWKCTKD